MTFLVCFFLPHLTAQGSQHGEIEVAHQVRLPVFEAAHIVLRNQP